MKLMPVKSAQWLSITALMAAVAFAAGQEVQLPEGEGKTILNTACISCHGLEVYAGKQASRDDWKGIISRMQTYGATIDAKQTEALADYLVANFGKGDAAKPGAPATHANDEAMKKLVDTACGGCHGLDLITGRTGTQAEWQEVVDRMIGRGAVVAEKEVAPMVQYLTKTYAPK
jgi:cytochrome c5